MSSSKFFAYLFCLLTFSFLIQTLFCSLYSFCSTLEKFTSKFNDSYGINTKELINYLKYEMSGKGFVLGSKGQRKDQVQGLALCGIGVLAEDYKACLANAEDEIHRHCPYAKVAIIGYENYENCLLKFSNKNFGQIYNQKIFYVPSSKNVSENVLFDMGKVYMLTNVSMTACQELRMAAMGELQLDGPMMLYGSAQCTRDLSSYDCGKCLQGAISLLQSCCQRQEGARVSMESCSIRYEIYKFFTISSK